MARLPYLVILTTCLATGSAAQTLPPRTPDVPGIVVAVDFVFDNRVRRTNSLPTAALRAARRQMLGGGPITLNKLRSLADAGDGLAAFRFAKQLQQRDTPDPNGAKAHYYAIAAYTGRSFAVKPLARLLRTEGEGYSTSRLRHCLNAMTVQVLSGNADAAMLLGQMYADGLPFGQDLDLAQTYLTGAPGGGDPRAILKLGISMMSDPDDAAAGHPGARSALMLAASTENLSVRVTAENLLRLIDPTPLSRTEVTQ